MRRREVLGDRDALGKRIGRSIAHPNFAAIVLAILQHTGLDPHKLELEITETCFIENAAACGPNIATLRAQGGRIALDDFGMPIPMKPPLVSEMIASPCSEMMSLPGAWPGSGRSVRCRAPMPGWRTALARADTGRP
ncbi:EAL domain-containing protein [Sphingobium sp. AN641]|uniref:EAL domain-containing protein n=1 Tax=Sphingobium sp. AN641 TaxID=3133443 RepID=UPI0030BDCA5C